MALTDRPGTAGRGAPTAGWKPRTSPAVQVAATSHRLEMRMPGAPENEVGTKGLSTRWRSRHLGTDPRGVRGALLVRSLAPSAAPRGGPKREKGGLTPRAAPP